MTPSNGQTIVFSKVPAGSYARVGESYIVTRPTVQRKGKKVPSRYITLTNVATGSGTDDAAPMYRNAQFEVIS